MSGKFYCGTSGFSYDHWIGKFYPQDLPRNKWLTYYAKTFNAVEINYTFYHIPRESTVEKWQHSAPNDFIYSLKASKLITHYDKGKLNSATYLLWKFLKISELLGEHRGPILMQFPPSFMDEMALNEFLARIKPPHRVAMEFRNKMFAENESVRQKLAMHNVAFCVCSSPRMPAMFSITADFTYIRFHGAKRMYYSSYSEKELRPFAKFAKQQLKQGIDVFAFFNNDAQGHAVDNALTFMDIVTTK
ncbi:DUF72 domain-containing protein [bacterium]|nr:MAG: DUF72 domain-containing protein [bacterium]